MEKINATVYRNPFRPADRDVITLDLVPGADIDTYVARLDLPADVDFSVSLNGAVVPVDQRKIVIVGKNDWLAVCPAVRFGGDFMKGLLGLVLSVIAIAVVGPAVAGFFGATAGTMAYTFASAMGAAAFMMIGGALLNSMFPPATVDFGTGESSSTQTYNWSTMQSLQAQGSPVMVLFGTVRTAGQLLAEHVTMQDDKQYYNGLLCGGEGPLDSITDIRINDNPVINYSGVETETRMGTNDQTIISYFGDTFDDQTLGYELNYTYTGPGAWATHVTDGNAAQGLEVLIEIPNGLYHLNDNGDVESTYVQIEMEYRPEGGAWTPWLTTSINEGKISAVRRTFRLDSLPANRYSVRARCVGKLGVKSDNSISTRYSNRVYWTTLSGIIYDDFSRPNKALVGVRALATDQLSGGRPTITWLQSRNNVWVWNPHLGGYEQKAATNPAWACYDLIHYCRRLTDHRTGLPAYVVRGDAASRLIYDDFLAWATFCDEKNLKVNLLVEKAQGLWKSLAPFEGVGRGKVLRFGTRWGCICDAPSSPVQLFSMGNIVTDSFREEYLSMSERANAVEITFTNAAKNYQRDSLTVYGDGYDTEGTIKNPTQITLDGITSAEQAYREGRYRLNLNKYLLKTLAWEADTDAIACRVGDVVLVQHDIPLYGEGGRLVAATERVLTLDKPVLLQAGKSYQILVRLRDDAIVTRSIVVPGVDTETTVLTVLTPFGPVPEKYDVYAFGETSKSVQPVRVVSISRSREQARQIVALEYVPEVYNEESTIPDLDLLPDGPWHVTGLRADLSKDKSGQMHLIASWRPNRYKYAGAAILLDGIRAGTVDAYASEIRIPISGHGSYNIEVVSLDVFGNPIGSASVTAETRVFLPPNIKSLYVERLTGGSSRFCWTYDYPVPNDVVGFRVRVQQGTKPFWSTGQNVFDGMVAASPYETDAIFPGQYTTMVKAVDANGNESEVAAMVRFGIGDELIENVIYEHDIKDAGFLGDVEGSSIVSGNLLADNTGGKFYGPATSAFYNMSVNRLYDTTYLPMTYEETIDIEPGQFVLQATTEGNARVLYAPVVIFGLSDESLFWRARAEDQFWGDISEEFKPYRTKHLTEDGQAKVRVEIDGGHDQGKITRLKVVIDVPDQVENINDASILAAGTRLSLAKGYRSIKNVNLTIQDTGTGAQSAQIVDKDPGLGPLVKLYDASGTAVVGVIDAIIQGVSN